MKKILLYGHGGSYNHGAEAIIRCTIGYLAEKYPGYPVYLSTHFKEQDVEFDLPVDVYLERDMKYVALEKETGAKGKYDAEIYASTIAAIDEDTVCFSVGGDNYCYGTWHRWKTIHDVVLARGAKDYLWGCSVEPELVADSNNGLVEHFASFEHIYARESITYTALVKAGLRNVSLQPDPAFSLPVMETLLPDNFVKANTVAINISPLIIRKEPAAGAVMDAYSALTEYILKNTDMNVLLLAHVRCPSDDDMIPLKELYDRYAHTGRIALPEKHLCAAECKYLISECKYGIFARTHASIAAYSTGVPCVVVSYSVKARGIAKDNGMGDHVVLLEEMKEKDCLVKAFVSLAEHADQFPTI